jgi:hypothetical protein
MRNAKYIGRVGSVRPWIRKPRREDAGAHRAAPLKGRTDGTVMVLALATEVRTRHVLLPSTT